MNKLFVLLLTSTLIFSCNNTNKKEEAIVEPQENVTAYQTFGEPITDENLVSKAELMEKYNRMQPGDSIEVKFASTVNEVCQNKGCWMKLDMGEEEAMVKFKDYGFFMPKDIAGKEVIVSGVAYVEEVSVEDQRHYAEDAGATKEELAAINAPKRTFSFISNGVLIPEQQ